jgi:hypothetical protein
LLVSVLHIKYCDSMTYHSSRRTHHPNSNPLHKQDPPKNVIAPCLKFQILKFESSIRPLHHLSLRFQTQVSALVVPPSFPFAKTRKFPHSFSFLRTRPIAVRIHGPTATRNTPDFPERERHPSRKAQKNR